MKRPILLQLLLLLAMNAAVLGIVTLFAGWDFWCCRPNAFPLMLLAWVDVLTIGVMAV